MEKGRLRLKKTAQLRKGCLCILASFAASVLLAGCGGGGEVPLDSASTTALAKAQVAVQQSPGYYGPAMASVPAPKDEFKEGFNPSVWNNSSWYECNCGRNARASVPSASPWSGSN
jgi:hypothetical protein